MTKRTSLIVRLMCIAVILAFVPVAVKRFSGHDASVTQVAIALIGPENERRELTVEIADEQAERAHGLMHRTDLPAGGGMLFVFSEERALSFWMKNTLIPLDILFFTADGRFVSRASMEPCVADPCPMFASSAPALFALEVDRGEALTVDVGPGWRLASANDPE